MSYTLKEVWSPIITTISSDITTIYSSVTTKTITSAHASAISNMLYYSSGALLDCQMAFSDDETLTSLQNMLREVIKTNLFAIVAQWNMLVAGLELDSGKDVHQESFFDVADTPRLENKDFNEFDIKLKQVRDSMQNTKAMKDFYRDIRLLVSTCFF